MDQEGKDLYRRKPSYIISIVSITLVLFMLGLLGLFVLHANKLSEYVKENIMLTIMINENVKEVDIIRIQKMLDATRYIKTSEFISNEEAAKRLSEDLGEDFIKFLGYNPLLSSIDIQLHAKYANSDSIEIIKNEILSAYPELKEIYYEKSLLDKINENINTISIILLGFSSLLFIIVVTLINNTIRLALYSKRFLIKSMQLIGATQGFIRKPFLIKGVLHGLIGGIFAILLLTGLLYFAQYKIPELKLLQDFKQFGLLYIFILLVGICMSWWSTYIAVKKYLRMKLDDLF